MKVVQRLNSWCVLNKREKSQWWILVKQTSCCSQEKFPQDTVRITRETLVTSPQRECKDGNCKKRGGGE